VALKLIKLIKPKAALLSPVGTSATCRGVKASLQSTLQHVL